MNTNKRRTISHEEKLRIVQAYHDKIRVTEIARVMGHKVGTISQIIQKYFKTGEVVSNTQRRGGTKPKKLPRQPRQPKQWHQYGHATLAYIPTGQK